LSTVDSFILAKQSHSRISITIIASFDHLVSETAIHGIRNLSQNCLLKVSHMTQLPSLTMLYLGQQKLPTGIPLQFEGDSMLALGVCRMMDSLWLVEFKITFRSWKQFDHVGYLLSFTLIGTFGCVQKSSLFH
jgi:hypothetical protein